MVRDLALIGKKGHLKEKLNTHVENECAKLFWRKRDFWRRVKPKQLSQKGHKE